MAGGVVAVAVIAIVLGVVLGKGGSSNGDSETLHLAKGTRAVGSSTSAVALQGAPDVARMFRGIPQSHFVLGKPSAPVELTEFIDLQCPACQQFETTELPTLLQKYVRTGKLRIKMEPWSILDRPGTGVVDSDRGQKATIAAAAQNKAFEFSEVLYVNQGDEDSNWMNDSMISQIAASVDGLKPAQLVSDANSSATTTLVNAVDSRANAATANLPATEIGTPLLLLAKGIEKPHYYGTGAPNLGDLEAAIDALLK
jgi:protein-disulfide isomerase